MNRQILFLSNPLSGTGKIITSTGNAYPSSTGNPFSQTFNLYQTATYKLPDLSDNSNYTKENVISYLQNTINTEDLDDIYTNIIKFINDLPKPIDELNESFNKKNFDHYFSLVQSMVKRYISDLKILKSKNESNIEKYDNIKDIEIPNAITSTSIVGVTGFKQFLSINNLVVNSTNVTKILDNYKKSIENKIKSMENQNLKIDKMIDKLNQFKTAVKFDNFETFVNGSTGSTSTWIL